MLEEIEGQVQGNRDGHGFLIREDGQADIYLPPNEMRAVLHKDRIKVRIVRQDRKGRPEGRVVEIIERPEQPIIGRLLNESGLWLVAPEDKRYGQDVLIHKGATGTAKPGQVVVVELTEPPALFGQPVGRIKEVLGEIDDPGMEIEIAVRKYSVPHEFSAACLEQAKGLPDKVRAQDRKDRVDLRDVPLVTIDGEDARDFDDAVYCEPAKVGRGKGWRLLVAIADVSHYVQTGSDIDIDAYDRATSVYFPRRVIPMRHAGQRQGRGARLPVLPCGHAQPCAIYLHRGGRDFGQHPWAGGGQAQGARDRPDEFAGRVQSLAGFACGARCGGF
jgi:ribonuclease R